MNGRLTNTCAAPSDLDSLMRFSLLLSALFVSNIASGQDAPTIASFIELPWRYVIGGYANGEWLDSENAGKLLIKPMEYRVFTLEAEVEGVNGAPAAPDADVCPDVAMQALTPSVDLERIAIGIQAPWNPSPRQVEVLNTKESAYQSAYQSAVAELLARNGITNPTVVITQMLRIDLEGDGSAEELIAATHYVNLEELLTVEPGDYSFVALRRVVNGQMRTQVLSGEFYPETTEDAALNIYQVAGVLDLNGDGVLEVLVNSSYYEGGGLKVWQLQRDQLVGVLAVECGV